MSYEYKTRRRADIPAGKPAAGTTAPGPDLDALMTGRARPTAAQKGRSIDLDAAIKAKMENAFGDLSNLKLYESPTVGQAGAEAMAMGNEIAFAPGMTDFTSRSGQERLGHELSHVMSQRSGQVRGTGFLTNAFLEAKADREGAMAAAGEQVYTGPVTHVLSDAAPSPAAAGPMQAKRDDTDPNRGKANRKVLTNQTVEEGTEGYDQLDPEIWEERAHKRGFFADLFNQRRKFYKAKIDRRPWEMTRKELDANPSNPNNVNNLTRIQEQIETAGSTMNADTPEAKNGIMNRMAWATFQQYNDTEETNTVTSEGNDWDMEEVDHTAFTTKLKNMSRMVRDYPELEGTIGNLKKINVEESRESDKKKRQEKKNPVLTGKNGKEIKKRIRTRLTRKKQIQDGAPLLEAPAAKEDEDEDEKNEGTLVMSVGATTGYSKASLFPLNINAELEGTGEENRQRRQKINERLAKERGTTLDFAANHEMGHMLNFLLVKEQNRNKDGRHALNQKDFRYHITASRLVEQALKNTMSEDDFNNLTRYKEDSLENDEIWDPNQKLAADEEWETSDKDLEQRFLTDQINLSASDLAKKGYTTEYGATNAAEFFAEAFADVYQNGKEARKTSIELVKLYEAEMKKAKEANKKANEKL